MEGRKDWAFTSWVISQQDRNLDFKMGNVVSIFFNLEEAYDTIWKYHGTMKYLYDMDFREHFLSK